MNVLKRFLLLLLSLTMLLSLFGCNMSKADAAQIADALVNGLAQELQELENKESDSSATISEKNSTLDEHGYYYCKDEVALYIHQYGKLPENFITKNKAQSLGWEGGSLEPYAPGKCIGGSHFGNYEGVLPSKKGRSYTECDIDTLGRKSRGSKRIVFSNDGLIYYTDDHYKTFELLYGGD